jgi:hypothetical protein
MINDHLLEAIREDADLLTKTDMWLEEEKNYFTEQLRKNIEELKPILLAIAIKQKLQQQNMVPRQKFIRNSTGQIENVVIDFCKLPEALKDMVYNSKDTLDQLIAAGNIATWQIDGYDVNTCMQMTSKGI